MVSTSDQLVVVDAQVGEAIEDCGSPSNDPCGDPWRSGDHSLPHQFLLDRIPETAATATLKAESAPSLAGTGAMPPISRLQRRPMPGRPLVTRQ
jgi:hypothetical protein